MRRQNEEKQKIWGRIYGKNVIQLAPQSSKIEKDKLSDQDHNKGNKCPLQESWNRANRKWKSGVSEAKAAL